MCPMAALLLWCSKQLTRTRFASSQHMKCPRRQHHEKEGRNDMVKRDLKRIYRTGKPSMEDVTRDEEIRRKVQDEFPPLETEATQPVLSDPLKKAIAHSP